MLESAGLVSARLQHPAAGSHSMGCRRRSDWSAGK